MCCVSMGAARSVWLETVVVYNAPAPWPDLRSHLTSHVTQYDICICVELQEQFAAGLMACCIKTRTCVLLCACSLCVVARLLCVARAFLDPYAKYNLFSDGNNGLNMDEFIDAREVVASLSAEYEACERPDYVSGPGLIIVALLSIALRRRSCVQRHS